MDASRFDTLARSLIDGTTRRGALTALLGGMLAMLGLAETAATKGKRKRKHKKKYRPTTQPGCTPSCGNNTCGPDGCGGECGSCTGGVCSNGACTCPSGMQPCQGACVAACSGATMLEPTQCVCCKFNGLECSFGDTCCTGVCTFDTGLPPTEKCRSQDIGGGCGFDSQCRSGICTNGHCVCPSDQVPCGADCWSPCPEGRVRVLSDCACCIDNGVSCAGKSNGCCAGQMACTGPGSTCKGRDKGTECTFTAQCATTTCFGGFCGGPPST